MKLCKDIINADNLNTLEKKGYAVPKYDVEKMRAVTRANPEWIHFGAGNIFRAFIAAACQELLDKDAVNCGLIVAEGFDYDIIEKAYRRFDNFSLLATLNCNGTIDKKLIASVAESLCADKNNEEDWKRLKSIFRLPSLKMASFTITEKGYALSGCENADGMMSKLTLLLKERFDAGQLPIALVSMDNCSDNGGKLRTAVLYCAEKIRDKKFTAYLNDENKVSFPCTMIDKITPRPDKFVENELESDGFENMDIIVTDRRTFTAPFVNAEKPQYLVIEDKFPSGRPPLENAGVIFTDLQHVEKAEKMKVCTCLNPLHTALAVYGCLLGYKSISEEMRDRELNALVKKIGFDEGLPVVINPEIIEPYSFIDEVVNSRLPNRFIPDTPQRIACDTSQKIPVRYGETIKAYSRSDKLKAGDLKYIPLAIAGWLRYLMAVDDNGEPFVLSDDTELEKLEKFVPILSCTGLGGELNIHDTLKDILSDKTLFGTNLYEAGLGEKIEGFFAELSAGKGAVRKTLKKYL